MSEIIKAEHLAYTYPGMDDMPGVAVFDDMNLTVEEGTFVAVLGSNGCGKSTLAKHFNAILLPSGGKVWVCGTPWNGKHGLGTKITVPLKGLCILERAEENSIRPVTLPEVLPLLMQQSFRPRNPASVHRVLELLSKLSESTGLYRLGCNLDPQAAMVAYQGMNRKENEA
jgi:energy-coupling factor transporter ATP-binding protein EcfA2